MILLGTFCNLFIVNVEALMTFPGMFLLLKACLLRYERMLISR